MNEQLEESEQPPDDQTKPTFRHGQRQDARTGRPSLPALLEKYPARLVWAVYLLVNCFVTIALLASVAMILGTPFIFPSLGPTALLLFHNPRQELASPRNTLGGHALGILCGYAALWLTGLAHDPSATLEGVHASRVLCAALSLASTGSLMILLNVWHPPAGATTLIVSLGIITRPFHLLIIEVAVLLLILQALLIHKLTGIEYPRRIPQDS
jgi:CBS-domain-containing membrane protein